MSNIILICQHVCVWLCAVLSTLQYGNFKPKPGVAMNHTNDKKKRPQPSKPGADAVHEWTTNPDAVNQWNAFPARVEALRSRPATAPRQRKNKARRTSLSPARAPPSNQSRNGAPQSRPATAPRQRNSKGLGSKPSPRPSRTVSP